jgi:hypothetical protein
VGGGGFFFWEQAYVNRVWCVLPPRGQVEVLDLL